METCFYLCSFRMLAYFCWINRRVKGIFLFCGDFVFGFCFVFLYELCFFWIIYSLNGFDIFVNMGLLQESSNKYSILSSLSTSSAGLWRSCVNVLLLLIPSRNQVRDSWLEDAVLRLVSERLVNLLSRTVTVHFHSSSVVALSPFHLLKPAGWHKCDIKQTQAATDILGFFKLRTQSRDHGIT